MNTQYARELLGFREGEAHPLISIRARFAQRVKESHPDTGTPHVPIKDLQTARDVLISALETKNNACVLCSGTGKVRGVIGMRACSACKGTGDTRCNVNG